MPTRKQLYRRKLRELAARYGTLERDTVSRSIDLLRDLRNSIRQQLAAGPTEAAQIRLAEFGANVDRMIADYQGQLNSLSNGGLTSAADIGRREVVEPLAEAGVSSGFLQPTPAQVNVLIDMTADLIRDVSEQMRQRIMNEVRRAALGDLNSLDAMRRITDILGIPPSGRDELTEGVAYRAERILRTELGRSRAVARHSQRMETAKQVPGLQKKWIATADSRTRVSHLRAHGQVVAAGEPFIVDREELMYPRDPAGSAANTINCRCSDVTIHPDIGEVGTPLDARVAKEQQRRGADVPSIEEELDIIERGGFDLFENIRPPEGRAPHGMGEEYQARRRIVSRIRTQMRYRQIARRKLDEFRGQTGTFKRWKIDQAQARFDELNKGIEAALNVANEPMGDWTFKKELIDGIFEFVSEQRKFRQ